MADGNNEGITRRGLFTALVSGAAAALPAAAQTAAPADGIAARIAKGIIEKTAKAIETEQKAQGALPASTGASDKKASQPAAAFLTDSPVTQYLRAVESFALDAHARSYKAPMQDWEIAAMQGQPSYERFLQGILPERKDVSADREGALYLGGIYASSFQGIGTNLSGIKSNDILAKFTFVSGTVSGSELKNLQSPAGMALRGSLLFSDFSGLQTNDLSLGNAIVTGCSFADARGYGGAAKIEKIDLFYSSVLRSNFDNAKIGTLYMYDSVINNSSFINAEIGTVKCEEKKFANLMQNTFINTTFNDPTSLLKDNVLLNGSVMLGVSDQLGALAKQLEAKGAITSVTKMNEVMFEITKHYTENPNAYTEGLRRSIGYLRRTAEPLLNDPLMRPLANDRERADLTSLVTFLDTKYPEVAQAEGVPNITQKSKGAIVGG